MDAAAPLLRKADTIVMQFEIPLRTVYHTVRFAKANGIAGVNPAPHRRICASRPLRISFQMKPKNHDGNAGEIDRRRKKVRRVFARKGMHVVITLGERGSLVAGSAGMEHVPAFQVQAVDTTGAGDAFIGSFAVFLGEGILEKEALRRANLYAALSTTKVGTQKSFCTRAEFEKEWQKRIASLKPALSKC